MDMNLPLDEVASLVVHRKPMLMIERLLEFDNDNDRGAAEACLDRDSMFVDTASGKLDRVVYVELVAQAYAVMNGYKDRLNNQAARRGFLTGVSKAVIRQDAYAGDILRIEVGTDTVFDEFYLARGRVECGGKEIAEVHLQIYLQ